jgi:hypothetical protein
LWLLFDKTVRTDAGILFSTDMASAYIVWGNGEEGIGTSSFCARRGISQLGSVALQSLGALVI